MNSDATIQLEDGKWHRLGHHEFHGCCDCELTHRVEYKIESGVVYERWKIDRRATDKARKSAGIKVSRVTAKA